MKPFGKFNGADDNPEVDHGRYEVHATLDGPGIRFHGRRRHSVPPHVWQAIKDAGQRVLDNYTRVGTPCGHAPWRTGENHCAVMICTHALPSGKHEVTRDELDVITLSPGQRHLMRIYPELNIACSRCKSPRGIKCTSPNGRPCSSAHASRKKTWHSTPYDDKRRMMKEVTGVDDIEL